jgi:hypothetical protein
MSKSVSNRALLTPPHYASLAPIGLLAAGDWFEIIAALIFFLVTGVAQWLQKRSQERRGIPTTQTEEPETLPDSWADTGRTPPPIRTEQPMPRDFDIEEQLRRLLNPGQPPEPPPLPPRLPPTQSRSFDEEPEAVPWESREVPSRPMASFEEADAAYDRGAQVESTIARRLSSASQLAGASTAFQHASEISGTVSARMREVLGKAATPAPSTALMLGSRTSAAAQALSNSLRNPATVRQAVLTSIVLQPPRALEPFP